MTSGINQKCKELHNSTSVILTRFQVGLIDIRRAIASAERLLDLIGILHHVLQLILYVLTIKLKS